MQAVLEAITFCSALCFVWNSGVHFQFCSGKQTTGEKIWLYIYIHITHRCNSWLMLKLSWQRFFIWISCDCVVSCDIKYLFTYHINSHFIATHLHLNKTITTFWHYLPVMEEWWSRARIYIYDHDFHWTWPSFDSPSSFAFSHTTARVSECPREGFHRQSSISVPHHSFPSTLFSLV